MDISKYYKLHNENLKANYSNSPVSPTKDFHFHDNYEIYLFLKGNVNCFVDRFSYSLQRGNILVFNKQEIHKIINLSEEPYERITIHFKPGIVQYFCTAETNLLACFQNRLPSVNNIALLDESQIHEFLSAAKSLIHALNNKSYGSDVLSMVYLIQMLVFVNNVFRINEAEMPVPMSSVIQSAIQYIDQNLKNELTLDHISKELSVDKYYLSHLFKEHTGGPIYRFILLKRVALAKQLLAAGKSVSEACVLSGFNDYTNFIRTFKNITGISPGKYGKSK